MPWKDASSTGRPRADGGDFSVTGENCRKRACAQEEQRSNRNRSLISVERVAKRRDGKTKKIWKDVDATRGEFDGANDML